MNPRIVLLACLASTLFMTGVIWFVQFVHYPLFGRVGAESFRVYHGEHSRLTTYLVVIPMVVELLSSAALIWRRPGDILAWMAWAGLAMAIVSWGATFALSVPEHGRLANGFDPMAHQRLVVTNLVRLASWTVHSLLILAMTARSIR